MYFIKKLTQKNIYVYQRNLDTKKQKSFKFIHPRKQGNSHEKESVIDSLGKSSAHQQHKV